MTRPKPDLVTSLAVTWLFVGFVVLCGIAYPCLGLSPSSYGLMLAQLGAPEEGPVFGQARAVREDEWAVHTALLQATVRNGFRRVNETSFYREDLRNFYILPLKDWCLAFKPEMWAFFVISPATAFSLYYSLLMAAFLVGYFILFRQMAIDPFVSASVAIMLYFSGFVQFWWTSLGSLTAGLPWILIVLLAPLAWWWKALLFSWVIPVVCFSEVYPTHFAEFTFAAIVLFLAVRPSLFRSPGDMAALAIGGLVTGVVFAVYFKDMIPIMRNTWYPGKRIGYPGTTPIPVVLSQLFPFLTFSLRDYHNFVSNNICESGSVGSFLPLLTLCLVPPRLLWADRRLRYGLMLVLAAFALIVTWQITPAPHWIGHVLLWDHANAERLLYTSGFLLTVACLLIWREKLVTPSPLRIGLFVAVGPVLSLILKMAIFHIPLSESPIDLTLTVVGVVAGAAACAARPAARLPILLGTIALMNVWVFGRFNPLQPAEPIFQAPETETLRELRQSEESTPGKYLLVGGYKGATLNGVGFRSVSHMLLAPGFAVFRKYFPTMDATRFDFVFNRYAYVILTRDPLPQAQDDLIITLPVEAFAPIRNTRTVRLDVAPRKDCSIQRGGGIDRVTAQGNQLTIEGWAPWKAEKDTQELCVTSSRVLRAGPLRTIRRPDISESMTDYAYTRSGFQLELSSADGRPIQPEEVVLVARDTSQGLAELSGCGCPASVNR